MSDFGAWLPGLRHFFSWSGRIGRRTFFGGYVALCFAGGALGIGVLALLEPRSFEPPQAMMLVLIVALFVPLSALIAQRAHDIGMSAVVPFALFVVFATPMAIAFDLVAGDFGYVLARAVQITDPMIIFSAALVGNVLWMLFFAFLILKPGQPKANRFGIPPTSAREPKPLAL